MSSTFSGLSSALCTAGKGHRGLQHSADNLGLNRVGQAELYYVMGPQHEDRILGQVPSNKPVS